MQATDEAGKHLKNKGDEDAINFRPSSNFKYMKKYCKGKMEASSGSRSEEEGVRPPLPRGPPPPDSPPPLLTPKEEMDEDEYTPPADDEGKERVMCRQFARGACTRGAACIYAHEIILSQLPGIYTFCRDYQNSTCTFQRCKFVHATVFEKEFFYRTGFLPPHATNHLKDGAAPAPQAPAHLHPEGGQAEPPVTFAGPPPAALVHSGGVEGRPPGEPPGALAAAAAAAPVAAPALARDIGDLGEPGRAEPAPAPPPRDKCSNCDYLEFRRQCTRNKTEMLTRSVQDLDRKTAVLDKKHTKLLAILLALLKNSSDGKPGASLSAANTVNIRNDKEKAMMDKVNAILANGGGGGGGGHSYIENKGLSATLLRMLLGGAEQAAAAPSDP